MCYPMLIKQNRGENIKNETPQQHNDGEGTQNCRRREKQQRPWEPPPDPGRGSHRACNDCNARDRLFAETVRVAFRVDLRLKHVFWTRVFSSSSSFRTYSS